MDVNAESSLLQPANRDGGIDQDWAGDDRDWRDWYVTPTMSNCGSNSQPVRLDAAQREPFRRDAFIKLAHVISPAVVR